MHHVMQVIHHRIDEQKHKADALKYVIYPFSIEP